MRRALLRRSTLLLVLGACSSPTSAPPLRHLERPTDITFGCIGTQDNVSVAIPTSNCAARPASTTDNDAGPPDAGFEFYTPVGFIIEQVRGDVAIANMNLGTFIDSDKFAPGLNGLPVGHLPASVTTTSDGCYVAVANTGSCDLSLVNVVNSYLSRPDAIRFLDVVSSAGRILSQPLLIVAPPSMPRDQPPQSCTDPSGSVYVAYPACNLVARVDLATGAIIDGIRYRDGAPPEIVGPDVTCPVECTSASQVTAKPQDAVDAGPADAGPFDSGIGDSGIADASAADSGAGDAAVPTGSLGHPVSLTFEPDGSRLYIGAYDSPNLIIVDLDTAGKPTAVRQLPLEGAIGIRKVAATGDVPMGQNGIAGTFRFVYVIGSDLAIHVADVTPSRNPRECETQVDRRFLHGPINVPLYSCFPVGSPQTPPRRGDAVGPAIRLPQGVVPLDIQFLRSGAATDLPQPASLNGVFAAITAIGPQVDARLGRGLLYYINVDDDNYEDFVDPSLEGDIGGPDIGLALPHSLRDGNLQRRFSRGNNCAETALVRGDFGPPRLLNVPEREPGFIYAENGQPEDPFAPTLHRVVCDRQNTVWELQQYAPPEVRKQIFTDIEKIAPRDVASGVTGDETFNVIWEGPLAFEAVTARRAGGRVIIEDESSMTVQTPGAQLCNLGLKSGDIVRLLGCETDGDCGLDETCVVHPEAPSGVLGMCLPTDKAIELTSVCKRVLTTARRYTVVQAKQGEVTVAMRPFIFDGSPVEGCTSSEQCTTVEETILTDIETRNALTPKSLERHNMSCELEPVMGGPARCIVTRRRDPGVATDVVCQLDSECDSGTVCEAGHCVLGAIPPQACVNPLQRYEPHAGDSFVIISSAASFPHRQIADPVTGVCEEDVTKSPLIGNRIPRVAPTCTNLNIEGVSPNPCRVGDLQEPYTLKDGSGFGMRPTYAMRMRGLGFTIDLSDVAYELAGMPNVHVSTVSFGYTLSFIIAGGFMPHTAPLSAPFPERIKLGLDSSLFIIDSGDSTGGLTRGQILNVTPFGTVSDLRLR